MTAAVAVTSCCGSLLEALEVCYIALSHKAANSPVTVPDRAAAFGSGRESDDLPCQPSQVDTDEPMPGATVQANGR